MSGMNAASGRAMDDLPHIRQSIRDILTTRIGSRVMRRDYGSLIPDLIDHPGNTANQLRLKAATVMAVARWEPRVALTRVGFSFDAAGIAVIDMDAMRRAGPRAGSAVSLSVQV